MGGVVQNTANRNVCLLLPQTSLVAMDGNSGSKSVALFLGTIDGDIHHPFYRLTVQ